MEQRYVVVSVTISSPCLTICSGPPQQEDGEMRSAQLLKPASCRQTRHHAGTGSSHERQSTKIAKYCYDCRRVCCSVWGLRKFKAAEGIILSSLCCRCDLQSEIPNLRHNVATEAIFKYKE
ncbi:hypothetical protein PBY51_002136 [Eleginops maclovinus]|uniref:Uncharacterized protein n=1 Tax=Eleginops maclovinus TaxID=56733 RepID=A0AAN8ADI7_ELEMC|nr:hypothetical protein PBY51_002136 [Eleginops maclovinus]